MWSKGAFGQILRLQMKTCKLKSHDLISGEQWMRSGKSYCSQAYQIHIVENLRTAANYFAQH